MVRWNAFPSSARTAGDQGLWVVLIKPAGKAGAIKESQNRVDSCSQARRSHIWRVSCFLESEPSCQRGWSPGSMHYTEKAATGPEAYRHCWKSIAAPRGLECGTIKKGRMTLLSAVPHQGLGQPGPKILRGKASICIPSPLLVGTSVAQRSLQSGLREAVIWDGNILVGAAFPAPGPQMTEERRSLAPGRLVLLQNVGRSWSSSSKRNEPRHAAGLEIIIPKCWAGSRETVKGSL